MKTARGPSSAEPGEEERKGVRVGRRRSVGGQGGEEERRGSGWGGGA